MDLRKGLHPAEKTFSLLLFHHHEPQVQKILNFRLQSLLGGRFKKKKSDRVVFEQQRAVQGNKFRKPENSYYM